MAIESGKIYNVKEIDGVLCLVSNKSGRVVFELHMADASINFTPNDAVTCTAKFYCAEPKQ